MPDTIRLNKVLRELNISIDRVADFLQSKGLEVEKRPTAKISLEVYNILCDEFKIDVDKKIASNEVVQAINKEKEKIKEKLDNLQKEKDNKIIKASSSFVKFKKFGKIQLDTDSTDEVISNLEKPAASKENVTEKKESTEIDKRDNYKKLSGIKATGEKINLEELNKSNDKSQSKARRRRRRIVPQNNDISKDRFSSPKNKSKPKKIVKDEPSDEEVQQQIKETLEKLQGKNVKGKAAKYRKDKRDLHKLKSEEEIAAQEKESKILKVTEFVTASEIATMMDVSTTEIISACMTLGMMVTLNQRLDAETLSIVAEEFGFKVEFVTAESDEEIIIDEDNPEDMIGRPPIVTVMGHVDHGKTSLLDYIRKENVIAGESGGITQHIGAYSVTLDNDQKITFLDTPGHEAFTAMRARGAQVTDLVVIVIAADDDIMPQTKEAISHAQAASVPIVFAINKIDKPNANPDKVKESLSAMNLLVEDWGGKIQSQDISALNGTGVNELLEKVLLEAELLELKANPKKQAAGTVVEALLDKGRGYVSTILVQSGTLNIGDFILAGKHSGKVKAMYDERGKEIFEAGPSTPISILGLDGAPQAGDKFAIYLDEREAKQIANKRNQLQREQNVRTTKHITLDEIGRRIAIGEFKELNIILKGDVDGSVEALIDSLQKLSTEEIQVNIIHKAVGPITESDVLLASASDAIVVGFNVRPMGSARQIAEKEQIDIRTYSIIYDAINDIKDAMEGMLSPDFKEEVTGTCEIRETFKISKIGTIAGCMVTKGKIVKNSEIRLIREGIVIYTGSLSSLKRFKDDVKEVGKGYDCGLQIKDYNDIKVGDEIEGFVNVAIKKKI